VAGVEPAAGAEGPAARPRLAYVIGRLDRALRQRIGEAVRPHGLTTPQYTTLSVLRVRGGLSNAQLARRAFMTPQSMSELIVALERGGLIERESDPAHGRILRAELTRKGKEVLARCDRAVDAIEAEMLRELAAVERRALVDELEACLRGLAGS
jgi:DNA-binding MarR family transcriptional regulator